MATFSVDDPFAVEAVSEVPLPRTPLERVIAQVRFPPEPTLTTPQAVDDFRAPLRRRYPNLSQEHELAILGSPTGVAQQQGEELWRLSDAEGAWKVTLAKTFVALDASIYTSRQEFITRLEEILATLGAVRPVSVVGRLGVRYINRLIGPDATTDLGDMVRPQLTSMVRDLPYRSEAAALQSFDETVVALGDMALKIRTAFLPPRATIDPNIPPMEEGTWLLDLDGFTPEPFDFDPVKASQRAANIAERIYRFFRWSMSDEAIRRFGGEQ